MKASTYLVVAGLMVVGVLSISSPASAWSDTMAHYGSSSACSGHMVNPTHTGGTTYTFTLCVANSQATSWSASLINSQTFVAIPNCGLTNAPVATKQFTCTGMPAGSYIARVKYYVPGDSTGTDHTHYYYLVP